MKHLLLLSLLAIACVAASTSEVKTEQEGEIAGSYYSFEASFWYDGVQRNVTVEWNGREQSLVESLQRVASKTFGSEATSVRYMWGTRVTSFADKLNHETEFVVTKPGAAFVFQPGHVGRVQNVTLSDGQRVAVKTLATDPRAFLVSNLTSRDEVDLLNAMVKAIGSSVPPLSDVIRSKVSFKGAPYLFGNPTFKTVFDRVKELVNNENTFSEPEVWEYNIPLRKTRPYALDEAFRPFGHSHNRQIGVVLLWLSFAGEGTKSDIFLPATSPEYEGNATNSEWYRSVCDRKTAVTRVKKLKRGDALLLYSLEELAQMDCTFNKKAVLGYCMGDETRYYIAFPFWGREVKSWGPDTKTYQVIADYEPPEDIKNRGDYLRLEKGALVYVLDSSDSNWWIGSWVGNRGYFPASYVRELPPIEPVKTADTANTKAENEPSTNEDVPKDEL